MEKDRIVMSQRERDVLKTMSLVMIGKRTQAEAGRLIGRSERQVRRLLRRLEACGDAGVIHQSRGRPSNNRFDPAKRDRALALCRTKCAGFGPTLAAEKLCEVEGIEVSVETLSRLDALGRSVAAYAPSGQASSASDSSFVFR